jgi:hypothetical protein
MDDDNMNEGGGLEDIEVPRPTEQKKAKKVAREDKGKNKESAINVDELDRFEKIQNDAHANRLKLLEIQEKIIMTRWKHKKLLSKGQRKRKMQI